MVCHCLTGHSLAAWRAELARVHDLCDLIEARLDLLAGAAGSPPHPHSSAAASAQRPGTAGRARSSTPDRETVRFLIAVDHPLILTLRLPADLGHWTGSPDARRAYVDALTAEVIAPRTAAGRETWVDLELEVRGDAAWGAVSVRVRDAGGQILRSYHDGDGVPAGLPALIERLGLEGELPKLAVTPRCDDDLLRFLDAITGQRGVWVAMGEYGVVTRMAPALIGSSWTYASFGGRAAPGQLETPLLAELARPRAQRPDWTSLAIVGAPVAHSRSPEIHNRRLAADELPAVYVPLRIDDFDKFARLADRLRLVGASVTAPHKRAALAYADSAGDGARAVGAANTLLRRPDGRWHAENTDVAGFIHPLRATFGWSSDELQDSSPPVSDARVGVDAPRVLVIGAGGAARAVLVALRETPAQTAIWNRTPARAAELVGTLGGARLVDGAEAEAGPWDIVVQTTGVGMDGGPPGEPLPDLKLSGRELVYDLIYAPEETPLLARARRAGCRTVNGMAMLEAQAELQYRLFRRAVSEAVAAE